MIFNRDANCFFFLVEGKDYDILPRMNTERCGREKGHNLYIMECQLSTGRFSGKNTNILSTKNSSILMMSSSEYLFLESEFSFARYVSSCSNTKYYRF